MPNNNGPTYTVITDTHGYPWGSKTADFDLGDNTPSPTDEDSFPEAVHDTTATYFKVYGNHDVHIAYVPLTDDKRKFTFADDNDDYPITFIRLDTVIGLSKFEVSTSQIKSLIEKLSSLPNNQNVMVFTHVPMFPSDPDFGGCYNSGEAGKWQTLEEGEPGYELQEDIGSADVVAKILHDFNDRENGSYDDVSYNFSSKTGYIIGCFAGHVHNNIQRYYKGFYMETFMTNGANSYTPNGENNAGFYTPPLQQIEVDLVNKKVNGYSYTIADETVDTILDVGDTLMGTGQGYAAAGDRKFYHESGNYPKFRNARYIGYSTSPSGGAVYPNNNDGCWPLAKRSSTTATAYVHGVNDWVKFIRFDADGRLRYYGMNETNMTEIPNYKTATISFDSESTSGHWTTWTFKNGLYNGKKDTPVYNYKSGSLVGLNGYAIVFDSQGRPDHMTHNGSTVSYGNSDNWINVTHVTVYWRGYGDLTNKDASGTTPQIGLDNKSFAAAQRIDLVRSTSAGNNWVPGREQLLTRVVGANNVVYWLQDGRLTDLTDAKVGI